MVHSDTIGDPGERERIETQMARHTNALIMLKFRLNQLAPINNLPLEILTEIFLCFFAIMIRSTFLPVPINLAGHGFSERDNLYTWFTVAQVCRHWRATALSCSRLWSHIYASHPVSVMHLLRRSRDCPVTIIANVRTANETLARALSAALRGRGRIAELHFQASKRYMGAWLPHIIPTPTLVCLTLDEVGARTLEADRSFPSGFFQHCPILQELVILGPLAPVVWQQQLPPSLKRLRLASEVQTPHYGLRQVVDVLGRLPNLEELVLMKVILDADTLMSFGVRVDLPNLQKLMVDAGPFTCASLLSHLAFGVDVSMGVICDARTKGSIAAVVTAAAAKRAQSNLLRALSVSFTPSTTPHRFIKIQCGKSLDALKDAYEVQRAPHRRHWYTNVLEECPGCLELRLTMPGQVVGPNDGVQVLLTVCRNLQLPHVHALQVKLDPLADPVSFRWPNAFAHMTEISVLHVIGLAATGLPKGLLTRVVTSNGPSPMVWPRLEELQLTSVPFTRSAVGAQGQVLVDAQRSAVVVTQDLCNMLRGRRHNGVPIRRLKIEKCYDFTLIDLSLLMHRGLAIEWDGNVPGDPQENPGHHHVNVVALPLIEQWGNLPQFIAYEFGY